MTNKDCPCLGCVSPKRYPGCHAVCPEYKVWNDSRQQKKAMIREAMHNEYASDPEVTWKKKKLRRKR